jgi:hypothetical protein
MIFLLSRQMASRLQRPEHQRGAKVMKVVATDLPQAWRRSSRAGWWQ